MTITHNCSPLSRSGVPFDPILFTLNSYNDKLNIGLSLDENIQYLINQLENIIRKSDIVLEIYKDINNNAHH